GDEGSQPLPITLTGGILPRRCPVLQAAIREELEGWVGGGGNEGGKARRGAFPPKPRLAVPAQLAVPPPILLAVYEKVLLALVPRVVMAVMHTTTISASMTAYSTAVGPSSFFRKLTTDLVKRDSMVPFLSRVLRK